MIPLMLSLRNFMCYRETDPPLDLRGIHLACLAGANGHGKSTLLDAMTWALWGKTRAKSLDDIITLGQDDMEVQFEFALAGNHYRVIRKRTRGRSTSLELQIKNGDTFASMSEPTVTATNDKISSILKMDYETFINSAYLVQGRADEFTMRTPAERKRILGEILGLAIYDEYEQRAKDKGREAAAREAQVAARLAEIDRELEHEARYVAELAQAQALVEQLAGATRGAELAARALQERKNIFDLQQKQWDELQSRIARRQREWQETTQRLAKAEQQVAHLESVMARQAEIEAGYAALQAAQTQDAELNARLAQLMRLNEEKNGLAQQIGNARARLETEKRLQERRAAELDKRIADADRLVAALADVQGRLQVLEAREAEREAKRQQIQEMTNEVASLEAANARLQNEMKALRAKIDTLMTAEAKCPLCRQDLSATQQAELVAAMEAEGQQQAEEYRGNKARVEELRAAAARLQQECREIDRALQVRSGWQREEAALAQAIRDVETARQELQAAREAIAGLEAQLTTAAFAVEAQAAMQQVEERIAQLGYDEAQHAAVRRQVENGRAFEAEKRELDAAQRLLEREKASCQELERAVRRSAEELAEERAKQQALADSLAGAEDVRRELREALARLEETRMREQRARTDLGAAKQKLEYCKSLRQERERQVAQRQQAAQERAIYAELQVAFSQKGLRAWIIEDIIPELEEEANRLLARMTDNRMHLQFNTQRETLKGDTVETLEIQIADELGTRSYEMYSGGEAFRVNFAIRIALSKLLARRAGAQLQTLIIDEGFGTQDAQGRERLVEAINSIKDDFACILVITHIEELQDAFPVRINVVKTAEGSRVEVI